MFYPRSPFRSICLLFIDVSFITQATRLLMFWARYPNLPWFHFDPATGLSVNQFLLLSTLAVVVLLGYRKWSVWGILHGNLF